MNLAITRAEVIAIIGLGKTKTFAHQKSGDLIVQSTFAGRNWFDLFSVLKYSAAQHGYPPPQASDLEKHAIWILSARLESQKKFSES